MKEESKVVENPDNKIQDEVSEEKVSAEETIVEEKVEEEVEKAEIEIVSQSEDIKNTEAAVILVDKAKVLVRDADKQLEECKLLLSSDLKSYETAKKSLNEGGLNTCEALLSELKYVDEFEEKREEDGEVFKASKGVNPLRVKDISSGKFTGFVMALIGGAVTLGGMVYIATAKLGVTLDVSKVPSPETIKPVFAYYGTLVGMNDNANIGIALVTLVTLLVMWIIYAVRVSSKGNKNLHFATQQLEDAEIYTTEKSDCKVEMDKVDEHINSAITTLKTYQVLLNEQKGKLQRVLYIEEVKEELSGYHKKSISEMKETQELINSIRSFMAVSMSEEGKLSGKSTLFLHNAQSTMKKMIEKLY